MLNKNNNKNIRMQYFTLSEHLVFYTKRKIDNKW